jgi:hypothetical protein
MGIVSILVPRKQEPLVSFGMRLVIKTETKGAEASQNLRGDRPHLCQNL